MNPVHPEMLKSRLGLMLEHPFIASAIARLEFHEALPSFCTTMATDGYYIWYNLDYSLKLSPTERMGVLAHEVLHCVFGHIDRRGEREHGLWNIAIDHAANLFLLDEGFTLPKGLYDRAYLGMTAEDIYANLLKEQKGKQTDGQVALGGRGEKSTTSESGFDLHLEPDDPMARAQGNAEIPSIEERRQLRGELLAEIRSHLQGRRAGLWSQEIVMGSQTTLSWEALLTRFFNGLRSSDYRLFPPNKKHLWRGIYLPSMGVPGPERIVTAIDTSGSMEASTISEILAEIDKLRGLAECELVLLQCDAVVQEALTFAAWETTDDFRAGFTVKGRGGTSFVPVFEWIEENLLSLGSRIDALFYFTDGYGDFPNDEIYYPVLWVMPPTGKDSVPFGEVLRMGTR